MKKSFKIILMLAAIFGFGTATVAANPLDYDNALGIYYMGGDTMDSYGIQYQHWFTEKIGLQTEGCIYYRVGSYSSPFEININCEFDWNLFQDTLWEYNATKLYAWAKTGTLLGAYATMIDPDNGNYDYGDPSFGWDVMLGAGFTFEFDFLEHFSIPIQFGFGGTINEGIGFMFGTAIRFLY